MEPHWGRDADEFVVDFRDLGNDVLFPAELETDYLEGVHVPTASTEEPVYTLFDSMPELVDYTFAFDSLSDLTYMNDVNILDRRFKRLTDRLRVGTIGHVPYVPHFEEDQRFLLPWDTRDEYMDRRRVAVPYKKAVQSYSGNWFDPANPDGGREVDFVDLARDQAANRLEALEGTVTAAGDGGVVYYGTIEAVAQEFTFQANDDCSGSSCSGVTTVSSELVPVTFHTSVREQNDGQTYRNVTGEGDREVTTEDADVLPVVLEKEQIEFDLSLLPPSTLHLRDPGSGAYYRRYQENTGSDELRISLVLQDRYRRDFHLDPDSGALYKGRGLPVMGFNSWTYDRIDLGRDSDLNEWRKDIDSAFVPTEFKHKGYRQPLLNKPYFGGRSAEPWFHPIPTAAGSVPHGRIQWPVDLEDLNWYLYKLPVAEYRGPLWLYWVSNEGRLRVVNSAYGENPVPFPEEAALDLGLLIDPDGNDVADGIPTCFLPGQKAPDGTFREYPASNYRLPLNIDTIECEDVGPWDWSNVWRGNQDRVNLPFDTPDWPASPHLLDEDLIVKQGVESAVDAGAAIGTRQLNRFDFFIQESERMGNFPPGEKGYHAERRYGLPRDGDSRDQYVDEWAFEPLDPNMPHLLVVTFYEAKVDDDLLDFRVVTGTDAGEKFGSHVFSVPKRRLQRVVCRMFVHPSGNEGMFSKAVGVATGVYNAGKSLVGGALGAAKDFAGGAVGGAVSGWLGSIARGVASAPADVSRSSVGLVCDGMTKLDEQSGLDAGLVPASSVSLRDPEGRIRMNAASQSKLEGIEQCHEISTPSVSTCKRASDVVFEGACRSLPEMRLQVRDAEFINLHTSVEYDEYSVQLPSANRLHYGERGAVEIAPSTEVGFEPEFLITVDPSPLPPSLPPSPPPDPLTPRNVGLTRAFLNWEFRWDTSSSDIHDVIDGFMVFVYPDQKSSSVLVPEGGFPFIMPRFITSVDGGGYTHKVLVDGFSVGGLDYYPVNSTRAQSGSDSLFHLKPGDDYDTFSVIGVPRVHTDYEDFNKLIHNMPLAPGFVHSFEVAPYVGQPYSDEFRLGPRSERVVLDGDRIACDEVSAPETDVELVRELYDCGPMALARLGYVDDGFRPGLLALTGTDICTDIFSSTPAGFTWDNRAVREIWQLVWILAGSVLFTLLVWQGLRMTYDVWLDSQPSVGFRELVPRFLLAAALAAGSLVICQVVLVVASDLTCFVAQYTGMSMWGVIGSTFVVVFESAWNLLASTVTSGVAPLNLLSSFITLFFYGVIILFVLFYILFLFLKVLLGMLLRIALLAVLVAVSPLAFVFYASDATAHWTKRWVTMFLGATFQQVVVLVVIYLGLNIMKEYLSGGADVGPGSTLVGMIVAFVTLSLAAAVPDIVNPAGKGIFYAFGEMGKMALAATVVAGTAIGGGLVGGIGGLAGGVGGAAGGGGAAGAGGGAAGAGGGAAGGGMSPAGGGGDNLISSVNRRPSGSAAAAPASGPSSRPASASGGALLYGPSGQPLPSSSGPSAPGSAAPDPSAPGSAAAGSFIPGSSVPGSAAAGPSAPGSSAPPGGVLLSTSPTGGAAPTEGAAPAPRRGVGSVLRDVGRGMRSGFAGGARRGSRLNTMMSDTMSGNAFYSRGSRSNQAAQQSSERRAEQSEERQHTADAYDRLSETLGRIDDRLAGI